MTKLLKYMTVAAVLLAVCGPLKAVAGEADTVGVTVKEKPALRNVKVKMNALVAIGVVNPAVEFKVMDNFTVQMEALGVFYSSNFLGTGKPLVLGSSFFEFRYYPKEEFKGFFCSSQYRMGRV